MKEEENRESLCYDTFPILKEIHSDTFSENVIYHRRFFSG